MVSRFYVDVLTMDASPHTKVSLFNALSKLKYFEGIPTPSSQRFKTKRTTKQESFKTVLDAPGMCCETKQKQIKDYFVRLLNGPIGEEALEDTSL